MRRTARRPWFLAAVLLAAVQPAFVALLMMPGPSPSRAQTQSAAESPLLVDGVVELDIWSPVTPERRQNHICTVAGKSLDCPLQYEVGPSGVSGLMKGTIEGAKIEGFTTVTIVYRSAECPHSYESSSAFRIDLAPDGTLVSHLTRGGAKLLSASGVRRGKAALSSGCKAHPATAPAGSNRSSHGGNEVAEAFD